MIISLKKWYHESLKQTVANAKPDRYLPEVDRFVIKLQRLGFNDQQIIKLLQVFEQAVVIRIKELQQKVDDQR